MPDIIASVDLTKPQTFLKGNLADFWRALRADHPVYWHPAHGPHKGFWVLSRHADILSAYRDDRNLTSERGNLLVTLLDGGGDPAAGLVLELTDGRRHSELRSLFSRALSPQVLKSAAERIREKVRGLISGAVAQGTCDFAQDIAGRVSVATISDLLGVPEHDHELLLSMTKSALTSDGPGIGDSGSRIGDSGSRIARQGLLQYFSELVERARRAPASGPGESLARSLVDTMIGSAQLSDDEIVLSCYSLMLGTETNRLAATDCLVALAAHPVQWDLLKRGAVPMERAVEEVLRWSTPTMHFARTAVREFEIAGTRVRPDDIVTLWNVSANRDEAVFTEPERFDLNRSPNRHITFGHGPHFCVGAYLARQEISTLMTALRELTDYFEITGPAEPVYSSVLRGIARLPVRFQPVQSRAAW